MSGGSLSSRVSNMKFMQSAGDRQRKEAKDATDQQETKRLKDLSEWSLPVNSKTMKIIKSKPKKVKKLGYSTISSMGPTNNIAITEPIIGRKSMTIATQPKDEQESIDSAEVITKDAESEKEKKKQKKNKKSKKKSVMDAFKSTSDDEFDPNEVDTTSKNLLSLWKAKKK